MHKIVTTQDELDATPTDFSGTIIIEGAEFIEICRHFSQAELRVRGDIKASVSGNATI